MGEQRWSSMKILDEAGAVNASCLEEIVMELKRKQFEQKLLLLVPWALAGQQKQELVKHVLQTLSVADLRSLGPNKLGWSNARLSSVWKQALAAAVQNSKEFMCPICMDPLIELSASGEPRTTASMWFAPLHKNEHWSNQPCGHACCRTCMKTWAETSINDSKVNIKCPCPGCSYCLYDHELQSLVTVDAFQRHQEHKNADYLKHLRKSLKEDIRLKCWLKSNARPCPDCHVIVSRSEGCNHMQCICGTKFCYGCGFKKCKCNLSRDKRRDIWVPKN